MSTPPTHYVSQRALDDIITFLQLNTWNRKCTMSLQDIAERLKYSATTLHRALKKLQADGVIEIQKSSKAAEPSTIIYNGELIDTSLLTKGSRLCNDVKDNNELTQGLVDHINNCHNTIKRLKLELDRYNELRSRVMSVTPVSDTLESIILSRPHKDYRTIL